MIFCWGYARQSMYHVDANCQTLSCTTDGNNLEGGTFVGLIIQWERPFMRSFPFAYFVQLILLHQKQQFRNCFSFNHSQTHSHLIERVSIWFAQSIDRKYYSTCAKFCRSQSTSFKLSGSWRAPETNVVLSFLAKSIITRSSKRASFW